MLAEPLTAFVSEEELAAMRLLIRSIGIDVTQSFQFWEAAVARITAGTLTSHQCAWDVEIPYGSGAIRVEVKYSREFQCRFRSGTRPVFKFAKPKGDGAAEKAADVIVLVGMDVAGVHTWAVPAKAMRQCASITLTSPRLRRGTSRSRGIAEYLCPPTQLLPEILRASRYLAYDHEHHQRNARTTRRKGKAVADLFPTCPASGDVAACANYCGTP